MSARYLPPDLYRRLRYVLSLDPHEMRAQLTDLVESAFGWGYIDGHDRGAEEAWAPAPLVSGGGQRVGTAAVRVNGHAPHPSGGHPAGRGPAHQLDPHRDPASVTPLRMGHIAEDIELDRLGTDQLDPVEAARLGHE
jgi:hypothetical protein